MIEMSDRDPPPPPRITTSTRVEFASREAVDRLQPYVDRVCRVVERVFDFEDVWISDESCLSDFFPRDRDRSLDQALYDRVGRELGIRLDAGVDDDHVLVRIARRLQQHDLRASS